MHRYQVMNGRQRRNKVVREKLSMNTCMYLRMYIHACILYIISAGSNQRYYIAGESGEEERTNNTEKQE